ncbi:MAG: hypothetical protein RLZZ543_1495 [Bacteroidota bacterium]|jgi:hypothetical protein
MRLFRLILCILLLSAFNACAPYYVRHERFLSLVANEKFAAAEEQLTSSKKAKKKRHRLLYLLERGYVAFAQAKYEESSRFLQEADYLIEDYRKNYGYEALALIVNPGVRPYKAEDFEVVMMHYLNSMNYLKRRDFEGALVECRRMNLTLQTMAEKFKEKPKYKEDAFAHLLMGLGYEASGDVNNAFIAYRNAYDIYKGDYTTYFEMAIPAQLKKDLIRTAAANGFRNEVETYRKEFGYTNSDTLPRSNPTELIVFWNNGLSPYKEQWSIDFTYSKVGDQILFMNPGLGLNFYFPASSVSQNDQSNLSKVKFYRVAFPRYVHRPMLYTSARAQLNGQSYPLELAENIDAIAFKSLSDRFAREMGSALLRFAIKKATEEALRAENKDAGALLGIANAITEQADTRNWQTLPNQISYTRVPLQPGANEVLFYASGPNGKSRCDTLRIKANKGQAYFEVLNTINR